MGVRENPKLLKNLGFPKEEWIEFMVEDQSRPKPEPIPLAKPLCQTPYTMVKQKGKRLWMTQLKCKTWDCLRCGPIKQKQLRWRCLSGKPTKMLTLTASSTSGATPDEAARSLVTAWRRLRRMARKKYRQGKIEFLAVFETTKKGMPHLHILTRMQYVPVRWISSQMKLMIGAPIVHIRAIENKRMASIYVTKYVSKKPERFAGCKRYWSSFDYVKRPKNPKKAINNTLDKFYVIKGMAHGFISSLIKRGYAVLETMESYTLEWMSERAPPYKPGSMFEVWA